MSLATRCKWEVIIKVNWQLPANRSWAHTWKARVLPTLKIASFKRGSLHPESTCSPLPTDRQTDKLDFHIIYTRFPHLKSKNGFRGEVAPTMGQFFHTLNLREHFSAFRVHGPLLSLEGIYYSEDIRNYCWNWMFPIFIFSLACIPWLSLANFFKCPSRCTLVVFIFPIQASGTYSEGHFARVSMSAHWEGTRHQREVWAVNGSWYEMSSSGQCPLCE